MTWEEGAGCYEACSRLLGRSPSKACFLCDRPRHAGFWQRSRHRRASLRCPASPGLAPGAVVPPVRPQVCRRACGPWARWGTWAHPAPSPSRSPTCKGGRRLLPAPRDCRGRSQVKHSRPLAPPSVVGAHSAECSGDAPEPFRYFHLKVAVSATSWYLSVCQAPQLKSHVMSQPRGRSSPRVLFFYPDEMCWLGRVFTSSCGFPRPPAQTPRRSAHGCAC